MSFPRNQRTQGAPADSRHGIRYSLESKGFGETEFAPTSCPVCNKCWLKISGPSAGKCIYGGPFTGYEPAPAAAGNAAFHVKQAEPVGPIPLPG